MSAASFDTPNRLWSVLSTLMVSSIPSSAHGWPSASSHLVSSSTRGRWLGLSPYTLLVDVNTNTASGHHRRVVSNISSVPLAFTVKSVRGSRAAQSCEGWAAAWTTSPMSVPYSANSASMRWPSRMSTAT